MELIEKNMTNKEKLTGTSIVFDVGNTLVFDPFDEILPKVITKATGLAAQKYNLTLNNQAFSQSWSKANNSLNFPYASHFCQEEPFIEAGLSEIGVLEKIRGSLATDILTIYRHSFRQWLQQDPRRVELRETLKQLRDRNKHLAVVSNDRKYATPFMLEGLGIIDLFDHIITSEEIGIEKPDPRVFEEAARRFQKSISDIVYIGDDPIRDIQCAHQAGAKAILYIPPEKYRTSKGWRDYSSRTDEPDATVERFSDIPGVVS